MLNRSIVVSHSQSTHRQDTEIKELIISQNFKSFCTFHDQKAAFQHFEMIRWKLKCGHVTSIAVTFQWPKQIHSFHGQVSENDGPISCVKGKHLKLNCDQISTWPKQQKNNKTCHYLTNKNNWHFWIPLTELFIINVIILSFYFKMYVSTCSTQVNISVRTTRMSLCQTKQHNV